jgi:hypothetical protein
VGDSPNSKIQELDLLKNRTGSPSPIIPRNLSECLKAKEFTGTTKEGLKITGYVVLVKDGGPETANCHEMDEAKKDTHIEIAEDAKETDPGKVMIVEITPAFKTIHPDWRTDLLRKALMGKRVTFTGYGFFDQEHTQFATASRPKASDVERATCLEIHPVTDFKIEPESSASVTVYP